MSDQPQPPDEIKQAWQVVMRSVMWLLTEGKGRTLREFNDLNSAAGTLAEWFAGKDEQPAAKTAKPTDAPPPDPHGEPATGSD